MIEQGGADMRMTIQVDGSPDSRRYNALTAPEIAVLIPADGYNEKQASRDIILHTQSGGIKRITETTSRLEKRTRVHS